jgi:nucleotide-binding universal stress UspA family protein
MRRDAISIRIVVPLNGSEFSTRAIPVAAQVAQAAGAAITLVAVAFDAREAASLFDDVHEAKELLPPGIEVVEQVIFDDDPAAALLEIAAEPDTVFCLASHDHMPAAGAILGSVGSRVIERALRPLFVVGSVAAAGLAGTDIAVAVDGQHDPEPLLAEAAMWARVFDAPVRLVTVYEPVLSDIHRPEHFTRRRGPSIDADSYLGQMRAQVERIGVRGVEVVSIPDPVSVADSLSAHLKERPALVVVAGGEHHARLVTPGVLRRLLRTVTVPVLLVPRAAARAHTFPHVERRRLLRPSGS